MGETQKENMSLPLLHTLGWSSVEIGKVVEGYAQRLEETGVVNS